MALVNLDELISGAIAGQVVSFPTDTVPALAVRPDRGELIYTLKQRSPEKPLILMGAEIADLMPYLTPAESHYSHWQGAMDCYWPGEVTFVFPASDRVTAAINPSQNGTVGVRIPNQAIAREILQQTGPLATTSANLSNQPPLQSLSQISATFPAVLALQLPESVSGQGNGQPSTVIQWSGDRFTLLRQGRITVDSRWLTPQPDKRL